MLRKEITLVIRNYFYVIFICISLISCDLKNQIDVDIIEMQLSYVEPDDRIIFNTIQISIKNLGEKTVNIESIGGPYLININGDTVIDLNIKTFVKSFHKLEAKRSYVYTYELPPYYIVYQKFLRMEKERDRESFNKWSLVESLKNSFLGIEINGNSYLIPVDRKMLNIRETSLTL